MTRRSWKQVRRDDGSYELVETTPGPSLPSDLRFDGDFVSPVDGTIIRSKRDLLAHNVRNNVVQDLPGMDQDRDRKRREIHDASFGEGARRERIEILKKVIAEQER